MAKTLLARGSDGLVSIHEIGADYNNPLSNLGNIYFSSALSYLYIVQQVVGSRTLPTRAVSPGSGFGSLHFLANHGLGYTPMLMGTLYVEGVGGSICGTMLVNAESGDGFQSLTLCADSSAVYLFESGFSPSGSYPARGISYNINVFGNAAA